MKKKCDAIGSIGYLIIFCITLLMLILSLYLINVAKLMSMQYDLDDALADATLSTLIIDDAYLYSTYEDGEAVIRFNDTDASYKDFIDAMDAAISNTTDFYEDVVYEQVIFYEVEGGWVTVTTYSGNAGVKSVVTQTLGEVSTPAGDQVSRTSVYAKVSFSINTMLGEASVRKTRDLYCSIKEN